MAGAKTKEGLSRWIERSIRDFTASSAGNSMRKSRGEQMWAKPLVGFSHGDDPLYQELKEDIGPFYWTPYEAFTLAFPNSEISPGDLAVISWILPHTRLTKDDNRRQTKYPCERWSMARFFGERFNDILRRHVVEALKDAGIDAVAPVLAPAWKTMLSERYGFSSNWSERHAAYVSGLGTFGLCEGLITPSGKAMRCGSVVARMSLQPTGRPYKDIHAYCLFYSSGACGKCMKRCPAGAITEKSHDKDKCGGYLGGVTLPYIRGHYGVDIFSCGLCQTSVPCESGIPVNGYVS